MAPLEAPLVPRLAAFLGAVREAIAAGRFDEFAEYTKRRLYGDDVSEGVQLAS